jgi:uncharacterized membrane protein
MAFGHGWALAGLALLVPLVWLHLRARGREAHDVASLLLWEEFEAQAAPGRRAFRRPPRPLLLALQALGLVLLILAVANPHETTTPAPTHVIVIDDSLWAGLPGRLDIAKRDAEQVAANLPGNGAVRIVLAAAAPNVIYSGTPAGVSGALSRLRPSAAPADLSAALNDAAALENAPRSSVFLIRQPEDPIPPIRPGPAALRVVDAGAPVADQGIFDPGVRCGVADTNVCEVSATVENTGLRSAVDRVLATVAGHPPLTITVRVGAGSTAPVSVLALPGEQVELRVATRGDPLAADDDAFVVVPDASGLPARTTVTLVGPPSVAAPLARALAAIPGVALQLRTPSTYRRADAHSSSVVVLDDFVPRAGLPPSPGVVLVDPPRLPGGHVGGQQFDTTVSGTDAGSPLLDSVDLTALSITRSAAHVLTLPAWLAPVAWSAAGPLLAAGDNGRQRVVVFGFEPQSSDLPQLSSFPVLAANVVRWASAWAPASAAAGELVPVDRTPGASSITLIGNGRRSRTLVAPAPGIYTVREAGAGINRATTVAVSAATPVASDRAPVSLQPPDATPAAHPGTSLAPWLLGAALLVLAAELAYWITLQPTVARYALVAPIAVLVLIALAVAAPRITTGSHRPTVLVVDRSARVDSRMRSVEVRWTGRRSHYDCAAPCRVVRFGAAAVASEATLTGAERGATDLAHAIDTAVGLAPLGGRIVVLSDGGQTEGDALTSAALARSRGIAVDWVPLADPERRDAALTAIDVPAAAHVGDLVPLSLTIRSTLAGPAVLRIARDGGRAAAETVQLHTGDNPVVLLYTATREGWHSFTASVSLRGDTVPANNSLSAVTDVAPEPRVLSVGDGSIDGLLAGQRFRVTRAAPRSMPTAPASYAAYDAVVLGDVPATELSGAQVSALSAAIDTGGLGLVVLGGPHSLSLGRYSQSGLQQLLPVASLVPGNLQQRNLAIELVLDRSGSMVDLAGGVPKIAMAREAARQSASFIAAHRDALGIVDFDIVPHLLVPLRTISTGAPERRVDRRIATLEANGGTNIYLGLRAGLAELLRSKAKVRHMILMTDGISAPANYGPLLQTLRSDHISVATVALGADADRSLLGTIAAETGGRAYATDSARQLPRIFVRETQLAAKPVRVNGRLQVLAGADSPIVRSLAGRPLPAVSGNVVVDLKNGAQADLLVSGHDGENDPALAQWQIGTGHVAVWTPGLGKPWGSSWRSEQTLWNDALRWTERGVTTTALLPRSAGDDPSLLEVDLSSAGTASLGVARITGTLRGASGRRHGVTFMPAGPALYGADISKLAPGVYSFALAASGPTALRASGAVALPYPSEDSPVPAEISPMGELATQTGGAVLAARNPEALDAATYWLRGPLTALAAILLLLGAAVRIAQRSAREPTSSPEVAASRSSSSGSISVGAGT